MAEPRRRRANGEASRDKILDAAVAIASERGYEGTSIKLVSERSGLPASSIYWHFADKDELLAAAIERSFRTWQSYLGRFEQLPLGGPSTVSLATAMASAGRAHRKSPDFMRLGLMLVLERRPEEPAARALFMKLRGIAHTSFVKLFTTLYPRLDPQRADDLASFALAASDGFLIAHELGEFDLRTAFDLLTQAILLLIDNELALAETSGTSPTT